eukprot:TRINITY_DN8437_c0_g1_i2.p1 TRINITY_DN8437_c0_g1~~TRINITY_DN8437_c0_g1_i2.p1  ORF type:complete len:473 (-),score=7.32 TRINITY_DN8437_c0_g1_i2:52-1470(-)
MYPRQIVDEISLLSPGLLEKMFEVLCFVRSSRCSRVEHRPDRLSPWQYRGASQSLADDDNHSVVHSREPLSVAHGLQLVICGDFFQLPPVDSQCTPADEDERLFAFQSPLWGQLFNRTVILDEVVRQQDRLFVDVLNLLRKGIVNDVVLRTIQSTDRPLPEQGGIRPVMLFTRNDDADAVNAVELVKLPGKEWIHSAVDIAPPRLLVDLGRAFAASSPIGLVLKVGAQVVVTKSRGTLCNGQRGVVVGVNRVPLSYLRMRYGHTLPNPKFLDLLKLFTHLPVVRFQEGKDETIFPDVWFMASSGASDSLTGADVVAARIGLPLRLSWALTIHRSQGMTLRLLEVDLDGTFAGGMAYVALSRGASLEGLRCRNFSPQVVFANPLATAFYDSLQNAEGRSSTLPCKETPASISNTVMPDDVPPIQNDGDPRVAEWVTAGTVDPCNTDHLCSLVQKSGTDSSSRGRRRPQSRARF